MSECDRETSIMRSPWPTRVCYATKNKIVCIFLTSVKIRIEKSRKTKQKIYEATDFGTWVYKFEAPGVSGD